MKWLFDYCQHESLHVKKNIFTDIDPNLTECMLHVSYHDVSTHIWSMDCSMRPSQWVILPDWYTALSIALQYVAILQSYLAKLTCDTGGGTRCAQLRPIPWLHLNATNYYAGYISFGCQSVLVQSWKSKHVWVLIMVILIVKLSLSLNL